jgi:hypothetical protein
MKNLKILMFGILLVGMHLTSCKKDADQQFQNAGNQQSQPDAQAQSKEKLFQKSITIYNADKTKSTILRFSAVKKELLDKMSLNNTEFTLVKNPESATEATGVDAPAISDDEGYSAYSNKDVSQSTNDKQVLPEDGIMLDFPSLSKTESIAIDVKSKDLNSTKDQAASSYSYVTYYTGGRKIQVTNLYSSERWELSVFQVGPKTDMGCWF